MLKTDISGVHFKTDADIKKHVQKKIGRLDRLLPKSARDSAQAEVKLLKAAKKTKEQYSCEVVLKLPNDNITVHEGAQNIFAAVDLVESKLKVQLKKYKDKQTISRRRPRIRGVFKRFNPRG